jgi:peptidoglycan/xylan/chitin deacetylase (PgdA/CDA1 family)
MLSRATRLLARRAPTVVVMYHRVGPPDRDIHGLLVRDDHFDAHLDVMRRYARIVPAADVLTPADHPRVAITFDDGYADNLEVAAPILQRHGAPATVFVTTGVIERGTGFWQDRLQAMVLDGAYDTDHLDVEIEGRPLRVDVRSDDARLRAYRTVHTRIRRRPPAEIETVVASIAEQLGPGPARPRPSTRTMTVDEVRTLDHLDGIDVGAHTMHHPWLAALDAPAQRREIDTGKHDLEQWLGRTVPLFAYPFGAADAFDTTSVNAAAEAGFALSFTTVADRIGRFTHPHRVPRRYVGDWDADTFERRFRSWFGA